ncbi:MAG: methyl-accepting chemotaxis protein, partial [Deltaproteobacteria bacterium]|nr:methyl-accepting chemotaxis protein [Deltaproteobacteria bacterium]
MLQKLSLRARLILGFLLAGIVPVLVLALISLNTTSNTIRQETFNKLTAIREIKGEQIEDYFATIRNQVASMSEDPGIVQAMVELKAAFRTVAKDNNISNTSDLRTKLGTYYTGEFSSEYSKQNNGKTADMMSILNRLDDESVSLQYYYIRANQNPLGSKHKLDRGSDNSTYSTLHAKYHPAIRGFLEKFGYYDVFLVDPDTGDVVYTVFKELDFTTSLIDGPYAESNLGKVFREANGATDSSYVKLIDFAPYLPSYEAPASFIASPIFDGDKKVGVLIFQMPVDKINSVMTSKERWSEIGLGASGESYLVAQDYSMRSKSRFLIEDSEGYLSMMTGLGVPNATLDKIRAKNTSILFQEVKTKGTEAALGGTSAVEVFPDYRGVPVVSAYRPLNIEDMNWVIMSEIDDEEAFRPLAELKWLVVCVLGVAVVGIGLFAALSARSIARPLIEVMNRLTTGTKEVTHAANQVAASGQALAQGVSEQAASLEETAASLEEVSSMTKNNNQNSDQASKLSSEVYELSTEGVDVMQRMSSSIGDINESADATAAIIKTIDNIAFQTNLLALNAAVEAARAGDAGKGFAVVAEEVRSLAQRSAAAAKETSDKIKRSKDLAEQGVKVSEEMARALEKMKESSVKAADLVKAISVASGEQTTGIQQVNTAVTELDKVTQTNAASAEESAAASEELLAQASDIDAVVRDLSVMVYGSGGAERMSEEEDEEEDRDEWSNGKLSRKSPEPTVLAGKSQRVNGKAHGKTGTSNKASSRAVEREFG